MFGGSIKEISSDFCIQQMPGTAKNIYIFYYFYIQSIYGRSSSEKCDRVKQNLIFASFCIKQLQLTFDYLFSLFKKEEIPNFSKVSDVNRRKIQQTEEH